MNERATSTRAGAKDRALGYVRDRILTGEFRGVVAFPTEELIGAELNTGFGLGIVIAYRLQQHLHLYAGWDYVNFGTD